jgi:hypothetical protein
MTDVVDLDKARLAAAAKKGYRNWTSQLEGSFDLETRLSHISIECLGLLAKGKEKSTFYLHDLIMNLLNLGSGFQFYELDSNEKMQVVDRYLFVLDRIRFEYMKRLGWLDDYPGEEMTIVNLILQYDELAPGMQAKAPMLSRNHPAYEKFSHMDAFDREGLMRGLIPKVLKEIQD